MVEIIGAIRPEDVYDAEAVRRMQEEVLMHEIGISQEVLAMLSPRREIVNDDEPNRILMPEGLTLNDVPLPARKKPGHPRKTKVQEEEPVPAESSDDESSEEQLSFEQLRAARIAAEQRSVGMRAQIPDDQFELE
jgi:hypothetical protein